MLISDGIELAFGLSRLGVERCLQFHKHGRRYPVVDVGLIELRAPLAEVRDDVLQLGQSGIDFAVSLR
jgi:hypothetical protein